MSIIDVITNSNPIVQNKQTKVWIQVTKAFYENNLSTYRVIEKSEINPLIWHGVTTGDNITENRFFKKFNDRNGIPMEFGIKDDDDYTYDFDGVGYPHEISQEDLDFLLGEDNNVFTSYSFDSNTFSKTIWGISGEGHYYYNPLGAITKTGVMDLLKDKDYAKNILDGGITAQKDITLVSKFFKVLLQQKNLTSGSRYNDFYDYWSDNLFYMRQNLIKATRDLAFLVNGISPGQYSLDVFTQKIDVVTTFILDYGAIDPTPILEAYGSSNIEDGLKIEYPVIKNYTGGSMGLSSEEELGDTLGSKAIVLRKKIIWEASLSSGILYSNPDALPDVKNPHLLNGEPKPIPDNLSAERQAVINFLTNKAGNFKGIDLSDSSFEGILVGITNINEIEPEFNFSIRNPDGSPFRVTELASISGNTSGLTFLNNDLTTPLSVEAYLIEKYLELAMDLQDKTNLRIDVESTNLAEGIIIYDLTKTIDRLAFDQGFYLATLIASNKINQIKNGLWVQLDRLLDDTDLLDDSQAISIALQATANVHQQAASSEYEQDEISKEELAERQKIIEQCALLLNLKDLANEYNIRNRRLYVNSNAAIHLKNYGVHPIHNPTGKNGQYFGSRFLQFNSKNAGKTMTALYSSPSLVEFLKSTPDIQSLLVPKIKIQKVIYENSGIKTIDIPFNKTAMETDNITPIKYKDHIDKADHIFRGGASGIKNITFDFDGETPATAQKYVKSTMSLKFQDFRDLVIERSTNQYDADGVATPTTFKYLDLIVNTTPLKDVTNTGDGDVDSIFREYYNPVNYCIKIDVGWNYVEKQLEPILIGRGLNPALFFEAVESQNKTFLMSALDHDLKINENGTIDLNINYFSFSDGLLNSYKFNALTTAQDENLFKQELVELINKVRDGQCSKQQLAALQAAIETKRALRMKKNLQNILTRLTEYNLVRKVNIKDPSQRKIFQDSGVFSAVPIIETDIDYTKPISIIPAKTKKFVFLGDLLYTLLDCLYNSSGQKHLGAENIVFALTDFEFTQYLPDKDGNPPDKIPININMAAIPIALDFFKEWFTEEIIASDRTNYPVMQFVMVLCNKLVGSLLTEVCFNKKSDKTLFFRQANIFGNKTGTENLFSLANNNNNSFSNLGILNCQMLRASMHKYLPITTESPKDASSVMNYIVIYADFKKETHGGTGDPASDVVDGIYHFYLGAQSGLLKTASFSKTNQEYLRESRMMRFKGIQDFAQLSNVYNVSMAMFGNFILYPGMEIYINPYSLGGADFGSPNEPINKVGSQGSINFSSLMGIGGYHLVKSVKVTIGADKFETNIEAQFIFGGDVDGNDNGLDGIVSTVPAPTQTSLGSEIPAQEKDTASCQKVVNVWETNNFNEGSE